MERNLASLKLTLIVMILGLAVHARGAEPADVWFSPDNDTPDFIDLFTKPEAWAKSRAHVKVFKFGPPQVDPTRAKINSYSDLLKANAFRKLNDWRIAVAIEAPAVKEWDCVGDRTARATLGFIENVRSAGTAVRFVAMDEPLVSGFRACRLTFDETAARTTAYVKNISGKIIAESGYGPIVGDIEPYPSYKVDELIRWIKILGANGFKPAFFHLDVDMNHVNLDPNIDLVTDLGALRSFFAQEDIPFGIIFWSGYDPEISDKAYYDHVIDYVRRVRLAIGKPTMSIFQSWVLRVSQTCSKDARCGSHNPGCTLGDPSYCGTRSVPVNLPDDDSVVFSHTRLIRDALQILDAASGPVRK